MDWSGSQCSLRHAVIRVGAAFQPRLTVTALEQLLMAIDPLPREIDFKLTTLSWKLLAYEDSGKMIDTVIEMMGFVLFLGFFIMVKAYFRYQQFPTLQPRLTGRWKPIRRFGLK